MEDESLKDSMILPFNREDLQSLTTRILQNPESFLNPDFAISYTERLQSWLRYLSILRSLLGFFTQLEDEGNSLKDLITKGYIK